MTPLKAPYPWFGGKSRVAHLVWDRFGDVANYIEPFYGSGAVLLGRPTPPRIETINDYDCYVANFWRSIKWAREETAMHADWPVNEADLHARHRWLVLSDYGKEFRRRMRTEPWFFDPRVAGWWVWGLCCWIGGGWCAVGDADKECMPSPVAKGSVAWAARVKISGGRDQHGNGIHGDGGASGRGVHGSGLRNKHPKIHKKHPKIDSDNAGRGVHSGRPQLGDAFSRGRGVHGNDNAEMCAARLAWINQWFDALSDRLRCVRVCCGDWKRVCNSPSVTTRLGKCGVFLDPPYTKASGRDMEIYATDTTDDARAENVADECRKWGIEWGKNPDMRIALCGYEGEHNELEAHGWDKVAWEAQGGYGNRSTQGQENAKKERIWFSPHCLQAEMPLFASTASSAPEESSCGDMFDLVE